MNASVPDEKPAYLQTLTRLGLTLCQSKVYLGLVRSGISTAKKISKVAKVTREDVYRIMPQLRKIGLAEKILGSPAMFKAIPIQDGLSMLLQNKIEETSELKAKTNEIIKDFEKHSVETTLGEEEPQFILVPENKAAVQRRENEIENAQTSIDVVNSKEGVPRTMFVYAEATEKTLKRGVKIRVAVEKPEEENSFSELIQDFKKYPSFELRYVLTSPPVILGVYDKKRMLVTTCEKPDMTQCTALWSNNPSLLAIVNDYFERLWSTALKNQHEEP